MSQPSIGSTPVVPRRRAARWWLAGGTFVVGLLAGVLIAGLLIRSSPSTGVAGSEPGSDAAATGVSASATGATTAAGATVEIVVNEECLRAINEAEDAYNTIDRIATAVTDFDLSALDAIIRDLQPLQAALRADVSACQVKTRLPDGSLMETELSSTSSADSPPTVVVTGSSMSPSTSVSTTADTVTTTSDPATTG